MKKTSKILGSIALSAALLMGTAAPAFALPWVEGDSDFAGNSQTIQLFVDGVEAGVVDVSDYYTEGDHDAEPSGYLFKRNNGEWNVVATNKAVPLDTIFVDNGIDWAWDEGASLEFTCWNKYTDEATGEVTYKNEVYDLWTFSYDELDTQTDWYAQTDADGVKGDGMATYPSPVIAFNYVTKVIKGADTAESVLESVTATELNLEANQNTRFLTGLNDATKDATDGANMGKRFPSSITSINIVTGA